jgi:hypothetical protein
MVSKLMGSQMTPVKPSFACLGLLNVGMPQYANLRHSSGMGNQHRSHTMWFSGADRFKCLNCRPDALGDCKHRNRADCMIEARVLSCVSALVLESGILIRIASASPLGILEFKLIHRTGASIAAFVTPSLFREPN